MHEQEAYWEYFRNLLPTPGKWLWISLGAFILFLASIYLSAAIRLAVGRVGWSSLSTQNSFLPSNAVHAILPLDNGQMLIATDRGVTFWSPPQTTDQTGQWIVYNQRNSGLVSDQVLSAALDTKGNFWFGTSTGVTEFQAVDQWISFHAADLHLPDERIISIAAGNEGRVYAGSLSGAAMWDGSTWTSLAPVKGKVIFALTAEGDSIWIGLGRVTMMFKQQPGHSIQPLMQSSTSWSIHPVLSGLPRAAVAWRNLWGIPGNISPPPTAVCHPITLTR